MLYLFLTWVILKVGKTKITHNPLTIVIHKPQYSFIAYWVSIIIICILILNNR